jgi:hypothetical protein
MAKLNQIAVVLLRSGTGIGGGKGVLSRLSEQRDMERLVEERSSMPYQVGGV